MENQEISFPKFKECFSELYSRLDLIKGMVEEVKMEAEKPSVHELYPKIVERILNESLEQMKKILGNSLEE